LMTKSPRGTVRLWDAATGEAGTVVQEYSPGVTRLAFSTDGKVLATGDREGGVKLWNAAAGREKVSFQAHASDLVFLGFAPGDQVLATAGPDGLVKLWDPGTGKQQAAISARSENVQRHTGPKSYENGFANTLETPEPMASEGTISKEVKRSQIPIARGPVITSALVVFAPDSRRLAVAGDDGTLQVRDLPRGDKPALLQRPAGTIHLFLFSSDNKVLAARTQRGTVKVWDLSTGEERAAFERIDLVAMTADGKLLALYDQEGSLRLWDVARDRERATFTGGKGRVSQLVFSPNGKYLLARDSALRLWDVASGKELGVLEERNFLAWTDDSRLLVTRDFSQTVTFWEVPALKKRTRVSMPGQVTASPDGRVLWIRSYNGGSKVWSLATGKERTLADKWGYVGRVSFSPNNKYLAVCGDNKLVVWDVTTGEQRVSLPFANYYSSVPLFSPDGQTLVVTRGDNTLQVWDVTRGKQRAVLRGFQFP
jgi:WD40 repeat protein